jgi:hypothetical protein
MLVIWLSAGPPRPAAGFGLRSNWPGIALIALGTILMLAGAII